jgi:hypothetical protein
MAEKYGDRGFAGRVLETGAEFGNRKTYKSGLCTRARLPRWGWPGLRAGAECCQDHTRTRTDRPPL